MRLEICLALPLLLMGPRAVTAQVIGSVRLRLGQTRAETLRLLDEFYRVDSAGGLVVSKAGPPYDAPGSVVFSNDRLVRVNRSWRPQSKNYLVAVRSVIAAIRAGAGTKVPRVCQLDHWQRTDPGVEDAGVDIVCEPGHSVQISIVRLVLPGSTEPEDNLVLSETWDSRSPVRKTR